MLEKINKIEIKRKPTIPIKNIILYGEIYINYIIIFPNTRVYEIENEFKI